MPENLIPPLETGADSSGSRMRLVSLAPKFDAKRHQVYFDLLERALAHESTRNVALTGAYGTGKSSVLEQLGTDHRFKDRVVGLSLSTIASTAAESRAGQEDGTNARVNQIQKEIVKQLLYRMPPGAVPQSRFRRATVPDRRRDFRMSVVIGLGVAIMLIALGPLHPLLSTLFLEPWRQAIAYCLLSAFIVLATWGITTLVRSRPSFSASVNTPITTVSLSKQSETYFDAYLDEIVYFFEATKRDIVVIEDIDRFEDVQVFDTLRALNGLLNGSGQVGRRLVFVYAIRDSVFEQIGANNDASAPESEGPEVDHAKEALLRASRTKFFDVIIPVVPFVSADNARDLMSTAMKSSEYAIDPGLIRLAARHVADMRMIHNIRNEFEIYRNRLVAPSTRIPGITDDLVFAIVLYKNTHLADFEKIRHRDSALDHLYSAWRTLVRSNLVLLRDMRILQDRAPEHARLLAQRVVALRDDLNDATPPTTGVALSPDIGDLESPETWMQIASAGVLHLTATNRNGVATVFSFTEEQLTRLLDMPVNLDDWKRLDADKGSQDLIERESGINLLRHHTWAQLNARTNFAVERSALSMTPEESARLNKRKSASDHEKKGDSVNFSDLVSALLPSDLARDLVRSGYLTSHFAQYASSYYGKHVGPDAREYIHRCIEPGIADATFVLRKRDVVQVLREQGADKSDNADLFSDASILNVSILDYLLDKRPGAANTVAVQMSKSGDTGLEFLDTYMGHGRWPAALLVTLAPHWPGVIVYAAASNLVKDSARVSIMDAVLHALPSDAYDVSKDVGRIITSNYEQMSAITSPDNVTSASIVLGIVATSGATVESIQALNALARSAAVDRRVLPVTAANLRVLIPDGVIALDTLQSVPSIYAFVLGSLDDYLRLVERDSATFTTVANPAQLSVILHDVAEANASTLSRLLSCSPTSARVPKIDEAPVAAWPFLAASARTDPSFRNVELYISAFGVDNNVAALLKGRQITETKGAADESRQTIAYALLEARSTIPSTLARVQTVASIKPGVLAAAKIVPESGDLVARLIRQRLLEDSEDAFSSMLMMDWPTLEKTIKASARFPTFVTPAILPPAYVSAFIRSGVLPLVTKRAVVRDIASYVSSSRPQQTRDVTSALIDQHWQLPTAAIVDLRAAGAHQWQVVALLSVWGDALPIDDLKQLLAGLGGDYRRVAVGGTGRPTFVENDAHKKVLGRLVGHTVRRVETKKFIGKGVRLVTPLM